MVSYSLMTWSRVAVHETPFQSQGSESRVFQLDKTLCGSSYTASLKVLSAQTVQKIQQLKEREKKRQCNNNHSLYSCEWECS